MTPITRQERSDQRDDRHARNRRIVVLVVVAYLILGGGQVLTTKLVLDGREHENYERCVAGNESRQAIVSSIRGLLEDSGTIGGYGKTPQFRELEKRTNERLEPLGPRDCMDDPIGTSTSSPG